MCRKLVQWSYCSDDDEGNSSNSDDIEDSDFHDPEYEENEDDHLFDTSIDKYDCHTSIFINQNNILKES